MPQFLRVALSNRLPTPVNFREEEALKLDGFPEFVSDISAEHQKLIDNLALQIVRSNDTNDPIFEFRVEGFADIARTIPVAQRKQFEDDISSERADNGFNLLVDALERRGGKDFARKIAKGSKAFGLGTQRLKVPNATTEPQFRQNRRVVFIARQVTFLPPPPEPPPPPTSIIEDRFAVTLIRSGIVTLNPQVTVVLESSTVTATLQISDTVEKKVADFFVFATGVGLSGGPFPIGGSITTDPGPEVNFKTFRLLGPTAPIINLKSFEGRVTVFIDGGGGVGPFTKGGTLSFSFDALEAAGVNTQPQLIRVPGGGKILQVPSIGAGDVVPGVMKMIRGPFDQ